ncbi:L-asparaginase [Piscinibacter sakaiensis]|uniref:L-asparaginase n=1 Tax=Piscinibacter sakaiensis TaxID=1547922 RepID=A0A0K8P8E2_PISS1|nr:L-asparaginase [Piscinibacter sakaiensis]
MVVLGTGGTIAGTAARAGDHTGYTAAQLGVRALLDGLGGLPQDRLEVEQVAQLDSKDMDLATWWTLARAIARHLARPEVAGVVVTHGTDTLEETAYFLHRVLAPTRPVVLTAAMRPATAASPDGPQNLLDAVAVARTEAARGVLAVLAGRVHAGHELRKLHGYRVDAFGSGDAGPLGVVENGRLRRFRDWPQGDAHPWARAALDGPGTPALPPVDIVTSHAGARAATVEALVAAGARGLVIAGTGNGTVHQALLEPCARAAAAGVVVWRTSRCPLGGVVPGDAAAAPDPQPDAGPLTPVQARVELMLRLAAQPPA